MSAVLDKATTKPPISVNGTVIAREDIAREAQYHPARSPADAYAEAARALVVRQLLLTEARRVGLSPAPVDDDLGRRETDEDALIRQLIDKEVSAPRADEANCRRYFEQNRSRFKSADLIEASHILFAAHPNDHAKRMRARAEAAAAAATLSRYPDKFGGLAVSMSACKSRNEEGRLGQISRGDTAPEIERALIALEAGQIATAPIETKYGWHVVRLDARAEGRPLPYEVVAKRIAAYLNEAVSRRAIAQYVGILARRATVTGVELPTVANMIA